MQKKGGKLIKIGESTCLDTNMYLTFITESLYKLHLTLLMIDRGTPYRTCVSTSPFAEQIFPNIPIYIEI